MVTTGGKDKLRDMIKLGALRTTMKSCLLIQTIAIIINGLLNNIYHFHIDSDGDLITGKIDLISYQCFQIRERGNACMENYYYYLTYNNVIIHYVAFFNKGNTAPSCIYGQAD